MKLFILTLALLITAMAYSQTKYPEINNEIAKGNFSKAASLINEKILNEKNLTAAEKWELNFQIDKMQRIRRDFSLTRDEAVKGLKKYYSELTDDMMDDWEKRKVLEMMVIDGEKKYFNSSVFNLFRIDKKEQQVKNMTAAVRNKDMESFLAVHIPESISKIKSGGGFTGNPADMTVTYTVTVKPDVVPDGEMIRCWLPYPREDSDRQKNVKLISANQPDYIIADNSMLQRTIYMEKRSVKGEPVTFSYKMQYTSLSEWHKIIPEKVLPYNKDSELYKEFTSERAPHIVFTDELKELSKKIVGDEKNPYLVAKKIFTWLNQNIPWASAREYSTVENISTYCYDNRHGDCGMQALLFITLARMNGIPAKWESGFMLHPPEINLHDWAQMYLEGYGWVPVDVTELGFGMQNSADDEVKYYYLGGIDSYRLVVNDDFSRDLYPSKIYPRSETVDFQRGELEWRGGNLYFDKWKWDIKVDYAK